MREPTEATSPLVLLAHRNPMLGAERLRALLGALEAIGLDVATAPTAERAWSLYDRQPFALVVDCVPALPGEGLELVRRIRSRDSPRPRTPVVLAVPPPGLPLAAAAGRAGATECLALGSPQHDEALAARASRLCAAGPAPPCALLGPGAAISEARARVEALAPLSAPVWLVGERGSGRHSIAGYLHARSARAREPFYAVSPADAEAAVARSVTGTVYLADLHLHPRSAQAHWLQGLRGSRPPRVLASVCETAVAMGESHTPLPELATALGRLRIEVPPLRSRADDFSHLVAALVAEIEDRLERRPVHVEPEALHALATHGWWGNLRELTETLEALAAYSADGRICGARTRAALRGCETPLGRVQAARQRDECGRLVALYRKHGTYAGMARELGITRNAAKYRLAKHGLLA